MKFSVRVVASNLMSQFFQRCPDRSCLPHVVRYMSTKANDAGKIIRNIGIMAHIDAGKTTTTERMLYYAGVTNSIGNVDDGTTQMDFMEEERDRGITIASAATSFAWRNHRINLIDTPGHVDFTIEVERALRVLDGAIAVIDGTAGVQAQTLTVWKQASKHALPALAFINKLDRDNGNFDASIETMRQKLGMNLLVTQAPYYDDNRVFVGVIDFVDKQLLQWDDAASADGSVFTTTPIVDDSQDALCEAVSHGRAALAEQLAELDDAFAEEMLLSDDFDATTTLGASALKAAIRRATLGARGIPVLCGSARRNKGVQPLMDAVVNYLPSPLERPPLVLSRPARGRTPKRHGGPAGGPTSPATLQLQPLASEPLCALVFKIVFDPHRGPLAFTRVYAGTLKAKSVVHNATQGTKERANRLLLVHADNHQEVDAVTAGNIVSIVGMKGAKTGDTLVGAGDSKTSGCRMHGIDAPEPVFTCSIEADTAADEDALVHALECITREDPSVRVTTDADTGQQLLSGMGELHLDIVLSRLRGFYKVNCTAGAMKVAYRERPTTTSPVRVVEHRITRIVGGKEHTAGISLSLETARDTGTPSVVFDLDTSPSSGAKRGSDRANSSKGAGDSGKSASAQDMHDTQEAVRQGILAACSRGVIQGCPLMDTLVTVTEIDFPPDSSMGILAQCAAAATRDALQRADVRVLHPVMSLEISADSQYIGDILQDLTGMRQASVFGVDADANTLQQTIRAEVALSTMLGYNNALRSMTSGTGVFSMAYDRHDEMTHSNIHSV
eukprot:m.1194265 g.1194265  ORF g.1194265 m.1194265 type:complete len:786 (-) comp24561_c0_seq9:2641-4998(-)